MATSHFLVLAATCLLTQAYPQENGALRNTIFLDERLEGGIFEHVDEFNDIALYTTSVNPYRLPTTTKPEHYDLLWMVNIAELKFSGEVSIRLYATQANVNEIVIHAHDLNIDSISLSQGDTAVPIQSFSFEPDYHFLRIKLLNTVLNYNAASKIMYKLTIAFNAELRKDMTGMYRNWFRNDVTQQAVKWMASTHFQATAARFAFPCYDEPNLKATFDVTIRRPIGFNSWFCTKLDITEDSTISGYQDDIFTTTPKMPTYLLAMIVAEYKSEVKMVDGKVAYEVVGRASAIDTKQHEYAFKIGQDLLAEMSMHTDYDFYSQHPNLKMTQAAIPDFRAGAMENWGLLVYREAYLMFDEKESNGYFKQLIAYILSHEIAHMWFGNLVTCDWWDNFWLNEGFARYYQYFLTDAVAKDLGLGIRFINEQVHTALLTDSANNPHPLTNPGIGSPVAIRTMFSTISYNKGASVIRMTEHLLGSEVNRAGLRDYLTKRQFDTALPIHLFESLQNAAVAAGAISEYGPDFSVIDYYKSWTEQAGHPVLNVAVNHATGEMTINQRRFNINSGYSTASANWIVPITFASASNPLFTNTKPTHIIKDTISVINRGSVGDEWVIFNKQQTGFYRVNYDEYTWNLIARALKGPERTDIHEYNRAQIVDDVLQFARSKIMTYDRAFSLISFLENETDYPPWLAAITGLTWIRNRLIGTPEQAGFEARIRSWTAKVMSELGYRPKPNESFMDSYLRYQLAPFVCNLGVEACRDAAVEQFRNMRLGNVDVPADSRNWVYCNALRQGTYEDFEYLWKRFLTFNVYSEKVVLLQVLGCTRDPKALEVFLDSIVQDNFEIRPQDYTTAFSSAVNSNEENTQIAFQYMQKNLDDVAKAMGSAETALSYVSARLRTEQQIAEYEAWAVANREALGGSYDAVLSGVRSARNSLAWAANVRPEIQQFIEVGAQIPETTVAPATDAPTQPQTTNPPPLEEPTTPELPEPDSAHTAFLSATAIALALIANLAMRY